MTYEEIKTKINYFLTKEKVDCKYCPEYPVTKITHDNALLFLESIKDFPLPDDISIDGENEISFEWRSSTFTRIIGISGEGDSLIVVWDNSDIPYYRKRFTT